MNNDYISVSNSETFTTIDDVFEKVFSSPMKGCFKTLSSFADTELAVCHTGLTKKLLKGIVLCLSLIAFCSCSNDGRLVDKFIKRVNAKELNSASKYIYPDDLEYLHLFDKEVLSSAPNLLLNIIQKENIIVAGQKAVTVKIECINASPFFMNYMRNNNMLDENNHIVDTIFVKETAKGDKITFSWTKIRGESLHLASISEAEGQDVSSLNIRSGTSEKSNIIGKLTKGEIVMLDDNYNENASWVRAFKIDKTSNIIQGYIKKSPVLINVSSNFFSLGLFDGLGLLVAVIILVVIAFPLVYMGAAVESIIRSGIYGILASVALIFALIYVAYQLLENVLFELFLINLPY